MTSFRPHAIEIDGGRTSGWHRPEVGTGYVFLVDVIEEDGGRLGLWSGSDYGLAIIAAEQARLDFEITEPVRDVIGGTA